MSRITIDEALQRVRTLELEGQPIGMRRAKGSKEGSSSTNNVTFDRTYGSDDQLYMFRNGNGGIITTAEGNAVPIIGEAQEANYSEELPPNLEDYLSATCKEIDGYWNSADPVADGDGGLGGEQEDAGDPTSDEDNTTYVAPLVDAKWGQGAPFSDRLSVKARFVNGYYTPIVGCPAIALAQIIYYWGVQGYKLNNVRYFVGCDDVPAYKFSKEKNSGTGTSITKTIGNLPRLIVFNYAKLKRTYGKASDASAEGKAVSELLEYVSKCIKSKYADHSSNTYARDSTNNVITVIENNKTKQVKNSYYNNGTSANPSTIIPGLKLLHLYKEGTTGVYVPYGDTHFYDTMTQSQYSAVWNAGANNVTEENFNNFRNVLKNELIAGRPVLLQAFEPGTNPMGHMFICEGYDSNHNSNGEMFYFNFGWRGSSDGWYVLNSITPPKTGGNYNFVKRFMAIIGIQPDMQSVFGDINGDMLVNEDDIEEWYNIFMGMSSMSRDKADFNNDGSLSVTDLSILGEIIARIRRE